MSTVCPVSSRSLGMIALGFAICSLARGLVWMTRGEEVSRWGDARTIVIECNPDFPLSWLTREGWNLQARFLEDGVELARATLSRSIDMYSDCTGDARRIRSVNFDEITGQVDIQLENEVVSIQLHFGREGLP